MRIDEALQTLINGETLEMPVASLNKSLGQYLELMLQTMGLNLDTATVTPEPDDLTLGFPGVSISDGTEEILVSAAFSKELEPLYLTILRLTEPQLRVVIDHNPDHHWRVIRHLAVTGR